MSPRPGLAAGDEIVVDIEKGVYRGLGLARHEGQVVFVSRALPGDRIRARVAEVSSGFTRAVPLERLQEGPGRRPSPCPVSERCGGCAYQEADYATQLSLKEGVLRESLIRAKAGFDRPIPLEASPEQGWRTRATVHAAMSPQGLRLGLHQEHTHQVVEFEECLQLSASLNRVVRGLRAAFARRPALAARLEAVDLAESGDGTARVAALRGRFDPAKVGGLAEMAGEIPDLTGLGFLSGRSAAGRYLPLAGTPFVHHQVEGRRLRAHVRSFFQANRFLVESLARTVVGLVPPGGTVLDLYSGVGLFSVGLGGSAECVVGVEGNETAVADASANAHGLESVRFVTGEILASLPQIPVTSGESIVLDPPRIGLGAAIVAAVAARRPAAVVYVSCDPPTLGRDLHDFANAGYLPDSIRAFDMFPDTFHLETVVRLSPR